MAGRSKKFGPKLDHQIELQAREDASLGARIKKAELLVQEMIGQSTGSSLDRPEPAVPFKLAETAKRKGVYPLVRVNISSATELLRFFTIPVSRNQRIKDESEEEARARVIEEASSEDYSFTVQVDETHQAAGFIECLIGPYDPGTTDDDRKIMLLRLVATTDGGAKSKNPADTPFGTTKPFPFVGLIVSPDDDPMTTDLDERYIFTIGNSITDIPSAPSLDKITCNIPDFSTSGTDSITTWRVDASAVDPMKTWADVGMVTEVGSAFHYLNDAALTGATGDSKDPIVIRKPITDFTATFVLLQNNFKLGKEVEWDRNFTLNLSGREKNVAVDIDFFPGGSDDFSQLVAAYTGQPGSSADGKLKVWVERDAGNNNGSIIRWAITQPPAGSSACDPMAQPALIRTAIYYKQKPNGDWQEIDTDNLLKSDELFSPGEHITGKQFTHAPNRTDINVRVLLRGVGTMPVTIMADSNGNGSTLNASPIDPDANDISTGPDGSTAEFDAYVQLPIYSSQAAEDGDPSAPTYAELGVTAVYFRMKRLKSSSDASDIDDPDSAFRFLGGPIPLADINSSVTIIRQAGLKTGKKYRIRGSKFEGGGASVESPFAVSVDFRAGVGTLEIAGLTLPAPVTSIKNDTHTLVKCEIDQPIPPIAPVALAEVTLLIGYPYEPGFITNTISTFTRLKEKIIRNIAEYSDNTAGSPPITDPVNKYKKFVDFQFEHKKKTSGIQVAFEVRARGGETKLSAITTLGNTGGGAPFLSGVTVPSIARCTAPGDPATCDIIRNTLIVGSTGLVDFLFRVYASDLRNTTHPPLGHAPQFQDVGANEAGVAIRLVGDTAEEPITENVNIIDPTATFIDIGVPGLSAGQWYTLVKTKLFNNGEVAPQMGTLQFFAGGLVDTNTAGFAIAIISRVELDKRLSSLTFRVTQPAIPVIFPAFKIRRQRVGIDSGYTEADEINVLPGNDLSIFTPGTHDIPTDLRHPQNATINVIVRVKGYINNKDSAPLNFTVGNDSGVPAPTSPPSMPALALITSTLLDGTDGNDNETTFTIKADETNTSLTFADKTFDSVIAFYRRQGSVKLLQHPFEFDEATLLLNSVTFEVPDTKTGKPYEWVKNVGKNSGGRKSSAVNPILFYPGNLGGALAGITSFSIAGVFRDDKHSLITGTFTQPNPSVPLKVLRLFGRQSAISGDTLRPISDAINLATALDDNGIRFNLPGAHPFTFPIQHKKPPNIITLEARLFSINPAESARIANLNYAVGAEDTGPPTWVTKSSNCRLRWKGTNTVGTIRAKTQLPDFNANTLYAGVSLILFVTNEFDGIGQKFYIWNPDLEGGTEYFRTFSAAFPILSLTDLFFKDIGLTPAAIWNPAKPTPSSGGGNRGDLPAEIYASLDGFAGGTMRVGMWFVNRFNPASAQLSSAFTSDTLTWPF